MYKLSFSDHILLREIANQMEKGENLERAIFFIEDFPRELLLRIQLGEEITEIFSSLKLDYSEITNLFASASQADTQEMIQRFKSTAKLIRMREEALEERNDLLKVHKRRMWIIRYVTLITIAMIAGFSPLFSNFYSLISNGDFSFSFSFTIWSFLSFSFLVINCLNNYYLLKMSNEKRILFKIVIVFILHIVIVLVVQNFFSSLIRF
ncbi:MAG: hypothetical protein KAS47_01850 [Candidatus Heimdallarchaeota archaeon]|nr:hypothetical protein [Candidatus Heimdallarchaeota archaeon]